MRSGGRSGGPGVAAKRPEVRGDLRAKKDGRFPGRKTAVGSVERLGAARRVT